MALRIKSKGSVFQDVPVTGALSVALLEWKNFQEDFKARRIRFLGGIAFAGSQLVFAGYSGAPFSNRAFNLRLRSACRALGVGEITAHGLRHSAATILLGSAHETEKIVRLAQDCEPNHVRGAFFRAPRQLIGVPYSFNRNSRTRNPRLFCGS